MYSLKKILCFISTIAVSVNGQFRSGFIPREDEKPDPFQFAYEVKDTDVGNMHSHGVVSDGRKMSGEYQVMLPDGRRQIVSYVADDSGYNAFVKYLGEAVRNDRQARKRDDIYRFTQENGQKQRYQPFGDLRVASQNNYPVRPKKMVVYEKEASDDERIMTRNGQRFKKMVVFKVVKPRSAEEEQSVFAPTQSTQQYRAENTGSSYGLYRTNDNGSQLVNKYQLRLTRADPNQSGTYYGTSDTYKIRTPENSRQEVNFQRQNINTWNNREETQNFPTDRQNDSYFQQNRPYELPITSPSPYQSGTVYDTTEANIFTSAEDSRQDFSYQQPSIDLSARNTEAQSIPQFPKRQNNSSFQQKRRQSKYILNEPKDEENLVPIENSDLNAVRVSETQVEIPAENQTTDNQKIYEQQDISIIRPTESASVIEKPRRGSRRPDSQRVVNSRRNSSKNSFSRRRNEDLDRQRQRYSTTEQPTVNTKASTRPSRRKFSPRSQVVGRRSNFRDGRKSQLPSYSDWNSQNVNGVVNVTSQITVVDPDETKCRSRSNLNAEDTIEVTQRLHRPEDICLETNEATVEPVTKWNIRSKPIRVASDNYHLRNNRRLYNNFQ